MERCGLMVSVLTKSSVRGIATSGIATSSAFRISPTIIKDLTTPRDGGKPTAEGDGDSAGGKGGRVKAGGKNSARDKGDEDVFRLTRSWRRLTAWRSQSHLVSDLVASIVYYQPDTDKSGLVVVNKPYGLPANPAKDSPYSLVGCLQDLAKELAVENLEVVKSCDRFCSGITLLTTDPAAREKIRVARKRADCERKLQSGYLAIAKGHSDINVTESFVLAMQDCPQIEKPLFSKMHKEPIIMRKIPKNHNSARSANTKVCHVHAHTLAKSGRAPLSLVNIQPTSAKRHLLDVWLADRGHPMLGDQLYDYRVRGVMGHNIIRGTQFTQANRTQTLDSATLQLFGLRKGEEWQLPKFVHNWRQFLPSWLARGKHLTVYAPPPEHFTQVLEHAKINFDFQSLMEADQVVAYDVRVRRNPKSANTDPAAQHGSDSDLRSNLKLL